MIPLLPNLAESRRHDLQGDVASPLGACWPPSPPSSPVPAPARHGGPRTAPPRERPGRVVRLTPAVPPGCRWPPAAGSTVVRRATRPTAPPAAGDQGRRGDAGIDIVPRRDECYGGLGDDGVFTPVFDTGCELVVNAVVE